MKQEDPKPSESFNLFPFLMCDCWLSEIEIWVRLGGSDMVEGLHHRKARYEHKIAIKCRCLVAVLLTK